MANKQIAIPYVTESQIHIVANPHRAPIDVICEGPLYMRPKEHEIEVIDGDGKKIQRKEKILEEVRDTQHIATIGALEHEAFRSEITSDGKCVWRLLK